MPALSDILLYFIEMEFYAQKFPTISNFTEKDVWDLAFIEYLNKLDLWREQNIKVETELLFKQGTK